MNKFQKLMLILPHRALRRGLALGVAAGVEHRHVLRKTAPRTVLDIGANIGQFSLALKVFVPGVMVYAFEPLKAAREKFGRLFASDNNVKLFNYAAGQSTTTMTMHVARRADSSSLLPITIKQTESFPGTDLTGSEIVLVSRVDELIQESLLVSPVLAKIDIQGFELEALAGMTNILDMIDYIYVELSFVELYEGQPLAHNVVSWLKERRFDLVGVESIGRASNGQAVQADFLFERSGRK